MSFTYWTEIRINISKIWNGSYKTRNHGVECINTYVTEKKKVWSGCSYSIVLNNGGIQSKFL